MQQYTQYIASRREAIEPESEDYVKNLIEVIKSFRPFDASLDQFLVEHGYSGDVADTEEKVDFIEAKFKAAENGLCRKEREILYWKDEYLTEEEIVESVRVSGGGKKERRADPTSTFGILLQILGLTDTYTSRWGKDRSLKPFLSKNEAIHPIAESVFPDRDGIEKILHGERVSYERVRKILILLLFYKFWIEIALENAEKGEEFPYEDIGDNEQRFVAYINDELSDVGIQVLYEGNPYDWIFLFASSAKVEEDILSPLDNLRGYMKQLIRLKQLDT